MVSIIVVNVWRNLPFTAIVLSAAINAVPTEIIEAANLDGANWFTRYRKVMVPIMAPIIYIALLYYLPDLLSNDGKAFAASRARPGGVAHV